MEIRDLVGKRCLLSEKNINCPFECIIKMISDNNQMFKCGYPNGNEIWLNVNEYKVIDTLNKYSLRDVMEQKCADNSNVTILFD